MIRNRAQLHTAEACRARDLIKEDVRLISDDRLIAALAVRKHADQVSHRAAGDKQRGFFAECCGRFSLKCVDRRILAVHVVTDFCRRHRRAHRWRRLGDSVAAKVDQLVHCHEFQNVVTVGAGR